MPKLLSARASTFEADFMAVSREIRGFREKFTVEHGAAETDSARLRLEKYFMAQLPKMYHAADIVLDKYNDWKARTGGR